jgi:cytochrome c556
MRVSRFLTAAGLALMFAVTMSVSSLAQAKTDEDFDKLMKAVGAANGAMRGAAKEQNAAGISAEAAKMVALFKEAEGFWKSRNNTEAAEWSATAMKHADAVAKASGPEATMGAMKELGGACQSCHAKYREGAPGSFSIKKG